MSRDNGRNRLGGPIRGYLSRKRDLWRGDDPDVSRLVEHAYRAFGSGSQFDVFQDLLILLKHGRQRTEAASWALERLFAYGLSLELELHDMKRRLSFLEHAEDRRLQSEAKALVEEGAGVEELLEWAGRERVEQAEAQAKEEPPAAEGSPAAETRAERVLAAVLEQMEEASEDVPQRVQEALGEIDGGGDA